MANWIASRCDNPSNTIIIDVKDEIVTTGTTVGVNFRGGENFCFTLVEQTLTKATNNFTQIYDSCLDCLNSVSTSMVFTSCFRGGFDELIIPGSALPFQPMVDKYYNLNLTITEGKESYNINDCYQYINYTSLLPEGEFNFNNTPSEYESCKKCAPFKSAKLLFDDKLGLKVNEAREYYTNILSGITTTNV